MMRKGFQAGGRDGLPRSRIGGCLRARAVWGMAKAGGPPCKYGPRVVRGSHATCPL